MVGLSCCRSNEAVNLSANTAPTFLADPCDEDAVDILLAAQQQHQSSSMGKSQWNAPYVSNIRLSDLDSLLSASASGLSQKSKRGSGSSSASSSLRHIIQLRRHHSFPSVRYFDGDSQDETTEDDFDDEEDDEEEQPLEEGDAVYVAESPSRTSIPREIGCAGTPVSSAYSVASTLDTTPRVQSLLLHRLRVRRMSSHSYLLQEQLHDNNNQLIRGTQDDEDDATSADEDENIVPVPRLQRRSYPSPTGSLSQSASPCYPGDDEGEELEAILYPLSPDEDESHGVVWDSDIPREIGPKRKPRLPTRRRRSSTSLLRLRVWGKRRPPSLRATKQFVHQLHAMS